MSRHIIPQGPFVIHVIGWDPGLNTFFLQLYAHQEEPAELFGLRYGEYPNPEPLVARLRDAYEADLDDDDDPNGVPSDLIERLWADRAAELDRR